MSTNVCCKCQDGQRLQESGHPSKGGPTSA